MDAKVMVSREGAVLRLVLNRPEKKNALDRDMYEALIAALAQARSDEGVRVVLMEGAGGDFTAGNDLEDFRHFLDDPGDFPAMRFVRALASFPKPLVAAVAGVAVGVGATLLFHCDLVYAAPSARFKMPFVDLGLVPEAGASLLAPRRFGLARASQYLLLCESFGADEALAIGLVNALAPEEELAGLALDAARRLAQKPAEALAATRRLLRGEPDEVLARIEAEANLFAQLLEAPEARARLEAFFAAKGR